MSFTQKEILLSVIVTAHSEGILLHRTLLSIREALVSFNQSSYEIIIHCDNPSKATEDYLLNNKDFLDGTRIYVNSFGDLGSSRNFATGRTRGKYIAFIDADDLMGSSWLHRAVSYLESKEYGKYIAHSETTVEFGDTNSVVIKHGEINQTTDTLLSVFANRWNSVIVAPSQLLKDNPYTQNSPGYGYEDWHLNCRFINMGIHNVLIPETVIFVRRKTIGSEWARQKLSRSVLQANPALSFKNVRSLSLNDIRLQLNPSLLPKKSSIKKLLARQPLALKIAKYTHKRLLAARQDHSTPFIQPWLADEWKHLHTIDRSVFLSDYLKANLPVYDTLTREHVDSAFAYKKLVDSLRFDSYSYIIFVPWLVRGGADQYAINYANMIASLNPDKKVLVIATLAIESIWQDKLSDTVDFLDFGNLTQDLTPEVVMRLLEQLIENSGVKHLHIINSELGYEFLNTHRAYIENNGFKCIATSFSQSTDRSGKVFGYSHTHVPEVYDILSLITTDNQAVANMWQTSYGFDRAKIRIHSQPLELPKQQYKARPTPHKPLRVLWAARLAPEKLPALTLEVAKKCGSSISIDMYGEPSSDLTIQVSGSNVRYCGPFNGFFSLELGKYDIYLYTSLFDGMPNAVLEAMAYGFPVVASNVGGIPEVINKDTGFLIHENTAEAFAKVLTNMAEGEYDLDSISHNARKLVATRFSTESYHDSVVEMLRKINYTDKK